MGLFLFLIGIGIQTFYNPSGLTGQMSADIPTEPELFRLLHIQGRLTSPEDEDLRKGSMGETAIKASTSRTDTSQEPPHGKASHESNSTDSTVSAVNRMCIYKI